MTRKAMAMFKCLVAPIAGNDHDDKKEYDIHHGDIAIG